MTDDVPNNANCANFVSGCLFTSGEIPSKERSPLVSSLQKNLRADRNFKTTFNAETTKYKTEADKNGAASTALKNAQPGDVVVFKTGSGPEGRHVS